MLSNNAPASKNTLARKPFYSVLARVNRSCEPKAWQVVTKESNHRWDGWQTGVYIKGDKKYSIDRGLGRPTLNTWYHVAYTYDGSNLRLYVNGVAVNSLAVSGSLKVNTRPVSIGADGSAQKFFNGAIGQARIYNSALTTASPAINREAG
jgi:hypothetical protein